MSERSWRRIAVIAFALLQIAIVIAAWAAAVAVTLGQTPTPGVPPGWAVYVVHAPWCAPCRQFRRDYDSIAQFRNQLESAFAVKSCEWERPADQRWARKFGVSALPSYIIFRNGIHQQTITGYDGNWRGFLIRLNLDPDMEPQPRQQQAQQPQRANPITPEERALPEISRLQSEILKLQRQMRDMAAASRNTPPAATPPAAGSVADGTQPQGNTATIPPRARDTPATPRSPADIPAQGNTQQAVERGTTARLSGSWGAVAETIGTVALTALAPQVALPAGAIGAVVSVAQYLRRRRLQKQGQQEPEQPQPMVQRQTLREVPVVVATDSPPPPAKVVETTHYVGIERDTHREAWRWAADTYARKYPGSEGLIQTLEHMMSQFETSKGETK